MYRFISFLGLAAVIGSSAACGGRQVEVLSTTTSPSTSAPSVPSTPAAAPERAVRGTIEAIHASSSTIVISGGIDVIVPAAATIRSAAGPIAFGGLAIGDIVSVTGTLSKGTITATAITVDATVPATVSFEGRVEAVSGTCPALTFAVADTTVTTAASTVLSGGTCAQIVNGVSARVTGTRQSDGSVNATQIAIQSASHQSA